MAMSSARATARTSYSYLLSAIGYPRLALSLEKRIRIDRLAAPPLVLGTELEDREVQVRRVRRRVARRADVADHLSLLDGVAFVQAARVALEMRVVVRARAGRIELVDRVAAVLADEQ